MKICCHINILEKLFIVSNCQTPFNEIKISNAPSVDLIDAWNEIMTSWVKKLKLEWQFSSSESFATI